MILPCGGNFEEKPRNDFKSTPSGPTKLVFDVVSFFDPSFILRTQRLLARKAEVCSGMAWPNPFRKHDENTRNVWGYTFQWTPNHFTEEEMHPLKYSYDVLAEEALNKLDEISPLLLGSCLEILVGYPRRRRRKRFQL